MWLFRRFDLKQVPSGADHSRQPAATQGLCPAAQTRPPQFARDDDGPFRLKVCFDARRASDEMKRAQGLFPVARGCGYQAKQGYEKS